MPANISRRRMIAISASFAGSAVVCASARSGHAKTLLTRPPITWHGIALGAQAKIALSHDDADAARAVLERCRDEISRLEALFSLYQPNSALSELNRNGELTNPAPEMLELISQSLAFAHETGGAFDITVQPLWQLYASHFSSPGAQRAAPSKAQIDAALARVDFNLVDVSNQRIGLKRNSMAITLNGIAQGYITDKVAALLRAAGYTNVLVHLGETYAMGKKDGSMPWTAGIQDPRSKKGILKKVVLENLALATSGGYGTTFSDDGIHHHLFDPRTGRSANRYRSVSVIATDALSADALSTAFSTMPLGAIKRQLVARRNIKSVILQTGNRTIEL